MDQKQGAVDSVSRFLRLVEARHLDAASEYLAPDVEITFPGGRRFRDLGAQVASSAGRFRNARKVFEKFDVLEDEESVIVYVFGTLEGERLDGESFADVRYIDRFELRGGRIVDQKVWNDMADSGVVGPSSPPG